MTVLKANKIKKNVFYVHLIFFCPFMNEKKFFIKCKFLSFFAHLFRFSQFQQLTKTKLTDNNSNNEMKKKN